MLKATAILGLMFTFLTAQAHGQQLNYPQPCSRLIQIANSTPQSSLQDRFDKAFIVGFFVGRGLEIPLVGGPAIVMKEMKNFCEQNPSASILQAGPAVVRKLRATYQ